MMMAYPPTANMDEKQMQEEMQRAFARQGGQNVSTHVVETRTVSIRGEDEKVTILESSTDKGYAVRQWMTIFKGKNGLVMLMIQGTVDHWNEQLVNDFIASIK